MFEIFSKKRKIKDKAHLLFSTIVEQSRLPVFYKDLKVADTLDGRFDLIILHVSLVVLRLEKQPDNKHMALMVRYLQEVLFDNMDMSLREIGVGDMSVGKKVKIMAEAYYGRKKAYQEALKDEDVDESLKIALSRNIYREEAPSNDIMIPFVDYFQRQVLCLEKQEDENLKAGKIIFDKVI